MQSQYSVSLRISGGNFDPDALTRRFSLVPKYTRKFGAPIYCSKGCLVGTANRSYWCYVHSEGATGSPGEELKYIAELLLPHRTFLAGLQSEGANIGFYVELFIGTSSSYGESFSSDIIYTVASLGAAITIEAYHGDQIPT